MTKPNRPGRTAGRPTVSFAIACLGVTLLVGCQSSGGGSRWASLNPWSRPQPAATESPSETAIAEATPGPKLPSDGAEPLIEALDPPASAVASTRLDAPKAPATQQNDAVNTPPPAFVASKSSPDRGAAAASAATPYNPDGYQPNLNASIASKAGGDRYATGNRYASATTPGDLPPIGEPSMDLPPALPPASTVGGRYAPPAAADLPAMDVVASAAPAAAPPSNPVPKAEPIAPPATGGRYAASPIPRADLPPAGSPPAAAAPTAVLATSSAPTEGTAMNRVASSGLPEYTPAETTPLAAAAPAMSKAAPPQPVTPSIGAAPSYPAVAISNTPPSTAPTGHSLGTLPGSVYAATPITPAVPAVESAKSEVRLTSAPGKYRPGGTGTYQPAMNIAKRPGEDGATLR
ncbi:MAG: hypothetical protein AAF805_01325 [Planctomycetota bacterium]